MKYTVDENLSNFKFWSGAKDRAELLTGSQLDEIGEALEVEFADRENLPTDTEINDLFWFDFEYVCGLIGLMYKEDGNVYDSDSWKEHAEEVIKKAHENTEGVAFLHDVFWDGFADETDLDELNSDDEIREEFQDYVQENYADRASDVLEEKIPFIPEEARADFIAGDWDMNASDDFNEALFFHWWDKHQDEYKED